MRCKLEKMKVKGFARLQLVNSRTGEIQGDSGFVRNTVVNLGFQDFIVGSVGGVAGSKQVSHMAIGTGTAPGAADTSLSGETGSRYTTSNSAVSSKTLQCTTQFAGSDMGGTCTIQNVALANTSSGGTVLCGTTYATSQWASNQNVNATLIGGVGVVATLLKKLRKFGEHLKIKFETIPSQAFKIIKILIEGVTTRHAATFCRVEGIV